METRCPGCGRVYTPEEFKDLLARRAAEKRATHIAGGEIAVDEETQERLLKNNISSS